MRSARIIPPAWAWPIIAAVAAYANALWGSFQFDDFNVIVNRENVHGLSRFLTVAAHGARPLLNLSYAINWTLSPAPFGFILVNVLLHSANSLLVFFLTQTLILQSSADEKRARTAALVVALHPVQTESVSYVSGRSESLMAFFYLGSILAYVNGAGRERKLLAYFVAPLLFLLAMAVRETAVTLPFALLLYETAFGDDAWKSRLKRLAPFGIMLVLGVMALAAKPKIFLFDHILA